VKETTIDCYQAVLLRPVVAELRSPGDAKPRSHVSPVKLSSVASSLQAVQLLYQHATLHHPSRRSTRAIITEGGNTVLRYHTIVAALWED
jgi:hypothetical protein